MSKIRKIRMVVAILCALFFVNLAHAQSVLADKIKDLWRVEEDIKRIKFVEWVNDSQSFTGLTKSEVKELLGRPDEIHDNNEDTFSGVLDSSLTTYEGYRKPVAWTYYTLQNELKNDVKFAGEGSAYLLDLIIQFNTQGVVYGAGTSQSTIGGDYYELLTHRSVTRAKGALR